MAGSILATAPSCLASEWEWTRGSGWTEGAGRARPTPGEQLRYAYKLERKGEYHDAAKQYFLLLRVYPDSDEAGVGLQRLAKCLFEMEDFYRSFQAIEQVIRTYPRSGRMADLVAIEYKIGTRLASGKHARLLAKGDATAQSRKEAMEVFAAVIKHDPYGPLADDALLATGNILLQLHEPRQAKGKFERLVRQFPESPLLDRARLGITRCDVMTGRATSSQVDRIVKEIRAKAKHRRPDQPGGEAEIDEESANIKRIEEAEAKKMWDASQVYFRRGTHRFVKAGKFLIEELLRRYPRTTYATQARELLPQIRIPPKGGGKFFLPKINLNPFSKPKPPPSFTTPQLTSEEIRAEAVSEPIPGVAPIKGESAAGVTPDARVQPPLPRVSPTAAPTTTDAATTSESLPAPPMPPPSSPVSAPPPAAGAGVQPATGKRWRVEIDEPNPPRREQDAITLLPHGENASGAGGTGAITPAGPGPYSGSAAGVMPRAARARYRPRPPAPRREQAPPRPAPADVPAPKSDATASPPPTPSARPPARTGILAPPPAAKRAPQQSGWQLSDDFD